MTATELVRFQLDDAGYQLNSCLEPMTEEQLDTKVTPKSLTPREVVEHLCEAYLAFIAEMEGQKHEWGSFSISDKSKQNLVETFHEIRGRATTAACAGDDEKRLKSAYLYLTAHDTYHVWQLCLVHLNTNPDWDPYSIYRM